MAALTRITINIAPFNEADVTITSPDSQPIYTDFEGTTPASFPATITDTTVWYLDDFVDRHVTITYLGVTLLNSDRVTPVRAIHPPGLGALSPQLTGLALARLLDAQIDSGGGPVFDVIDAGA